MPSYKADMYGKALKAIQQKASRFSKKKCLAQYYKSYQGL